MTEQKQEQSTPASKLTKLERLQKQKERLEQKKESLKAEARRIARAESQAARKIRGQKLVALGLVCEAMIKAGELTVPLSNVKKYIPATQKTTAERALEFIKELASPRKVDQPPV